jgi:hypothetical protein
MLAMCGSAGSYIRHPLKNDGHPVQSEKDYLVTGLEIHGSVFRLSSCRLCHHVRPLPEIRNFYNVKKF